MSLSRSLCGSLVDDAAFLENGPHCVSPHLIEPLVDTRRFENNEIGLMLFRNPPDPIPAQQSIRGVRRRSYESFFGVIFACVHAIESVRGNDSTTEEPGL